MTHYDDLEVRSPEQREAALFTVLPGQIAQARAKAPHFGRSLAGIDPRGIADRAALATLPVLRKSDLTALQAEAPPLGGLATLPPGGFARLFASPGPIYEAEPRRADPWRFARALFAAGFRPGQVVHNSFAYHLTPAGSIMESAAHALGCAVFPGGTGQTEAQLRAIADLRPDGYVGTPSFLRILLEAAGRLPFRHALVSAEAFLPAAQALVREAGIDAYQAYATADLGLIAYETPARAGLVVAEDIILEIVRPGTGEPVPDGEVGEVVVTTLAPEVPLIRFATGDLSSVLPGPSPCGRTNARISGWRGRADQSTKVRGMFVTPSQVAAIARAHPGLGRCRLVVSHDDRGVDSMVLRFEGTADAAAVAETLARVTRLRGEAARAADLPNDGKVIEDTRPVP